MKDWSLIQVFRLSILPLLVSFATGISGQPLQTVCSFSGTNGANPQAALTLGNDGNFYGTTRGGGNTNSGNITDPYGFGTVFKVQTNGTLTTLASFSFTNGAYPTAALALGNDGSFYGTTSGGGNTNFGSLAYANGLGTVFRVTTNGTLTSLFRFSRTNGYYPSAELTLGNDGTFYGTTQAGGSADDGTVFSVTTNGALTTLVSFTDTNHEPQAGLALGMDGSLYGSTFYGGNIDSAHVAGSGTLFKLQPNGTLISLAAFNRTNGAFPQATLRLGQDGCLYGTTFGGGSNVNGYGTVFKLTSDGALTSLASFAGTNGQSPQGWLTFGNNGNLYSTTSDGGADGFGVIFKSSYSGTLTTLASFESPNGYPAAGLTLGPDGNFYGTTSLGGTVTNSAYPYGMGTVFSIPSPDITVQPQRQALVGGSDITYYVTLASYGTPPFSVQWIFNGVPIAGATNTSLAITNFGLAQAGLYSVTVSNSNGQDTAIQVLRLANSPIVRVDGFDVGGGTVGRTNTSQITMSSSFGQNANIYYTLDGSAPSYLSISYQGPFHLRKTSTIRAVAYDSAYLSSVEAAPITVQITPVYKLVTLTPGAGSLDFSPAPYLGTNLFVSNTLVTITATASNGYSILGWLGDASGAAPVVPVVMNRDKTVEAIFGTTIGSNVLGAGEILFGPQVPVYPFNSKVGVTAIPQTGNYLIAWAGALSGSNNPNVLVLTNATPVVTALFGPLAVGQYALTVVPQGQGDVTVTPYTNRYAPGTLVTVTAVPGPGQTFTGWSGDASGLQNPLNLAMTKNLAISASFTSRPTLSASPPLNGLVEQGFRFSLTGGLGIASRIYGSSNLSSWVPLGWLTNELGTAQFIDAAALTNRTQYYRTVDQ